jgi:uncharacterized protein
MSCLNEAAANGMRAYQDYSSYLQRTFGGRVHKVSINAGYTCPNRDGTKSRSGCTYCNLTSLRMRYAADCETITAQINNGVDFFRQRRKAGKFLAYFQSYTNTYNTIPELLRDYREALAHPLIAGVVIGTRPDCISDDLADELQEMAHHHYVAVELGIESTDDQTLTRVNRCHSFADTVSAVHRLQNRNLHVGGHLILGFPWETEETMLAHADRLSQLPLHSLKLHHLQILRQTALAKEHRKQPFRLLTQEEYYPLIIAFLERSRPDLIFQRFIAEAPSNLIIAPHWNGIRNYQFAEKLNNLMIARNTFQGRTFTAVSSCNSAMQTN